MAPRKFFVDRYLKFPYFQRVFHEMIDPDDNCNFFLDLDYKMMELDIKETALAQLEVTLEIFHFMIKVCGNMQNLVVYHSDRYISTLNALIIILYVSHRNTSYL